jgi:hypothetical protein
MHSVRIASRQVIRGKIGYFTAKGVSILVAVSSFPGAQKSNFGVSII